MKLLNTSSYYRVFQTKDWPHLFQNFQPFQGESWSSEIKMSNVHAYVLKPSSNFYPQMATDLLSTWAGLQPRQSWWTMWLALQHARLQEPLTAHPTSQPLYECYIRVNQKLKRVNSQNQNLILAQNMNVCQFMGWLGDLSPLPHSLQNSYVPLSVAHFQARRLG